MRESSLWIRASTAPPLGSLGAPPLSAGPTFRLSPSPLLFDNDMHCVEPPIDQCSLLGVGPSLDLSFGSKGLFVVLERLDPDKLDRSASVCIRKWVETEPVSFEPRQWIHRIPHIVGPVRALKDVHEVLSILHVPLPIVITCTWSEPDVPRGFSPCLSLKPPSSDRGRTSGRPSEVEEPTRASVSLQEAVHPRSTLRLRRPAPPVGRRSP